MQLAYKTDKTVSHEGGRKGHVREKKGKGDEVCVWGRCSENKIRKHPKVLLTLGRKF